MNGVTNIIDEYIKKVRGLGWNPEALHALQDMETKEFLKYEQMIVC
jgi:hypothetical protein